MICPVCPTCQSQTLATDAAGIRYCATCAAASRDPLVGGSRMVAGKPETPQKGSRGARRAQPEAALVADIVKALRACGRTVLRCGQWRSDFAGSDAGIPDLFVWCLFAVPYSPTGCMGAWVGLEVKTSAGRVSPAQKKLADEGKTFVIHSIAEAFKAVGERL